MRSTSPRPDFGAHTDRVLTSVARARASLHSQKKQSPETAYRWWEDDAMDENAVLRELPCLECQELRAMRVRARLGAVVLALQRGETLPAQSARDLLRGCCKSDDE